jgi:low affinity Fe/Cu permease
VAPSVQHAGDDVGAVHPAADAAPQVKVDELIRSSAAARNDLISVQRREAQELEAMIQDRKENT